MHISNHKASNQEDSDKKNQADNEIDQASKQSLDEGFKPCIGFINLMEGNGQISAGAYYHYTFQDPDGWGNGEVQQVYTQHEQFKKCRIMQGEDEMMDARELVLSLDKAQRNGEQWCGEQYNHREILGYEIDHFFPYGVKKRYILF
ncbi:MAG: hypothetical protein IKW37_00275, partial [Bacteroidaceae bacterium]|nr:hypothetical protein [Bacteroidaceae bacterium]